MSVQALSCAFAVRGLSPSEKLVLLALANFANERMQCWPSQERLAADTELSERTVWGALKSLEEKRMVSRTARKRADGTRTTDVFTLHFALEVRSEPVANPANSTRNSCEVQSQDLRNPVAAVATLTSFEPSSNHQNEPSEPDGFGAWWEAYPRKVAKGAARKAYRTACRKTSAEVLLASLKAHAFSSEQRFIPHPATWLNGECWLDDSAATHVPSLIERLVSTPVSPWPRRMAEYRRNGFWNTTDWGPKPGKPGCCVPPEFLDERPGEAA